MLLGKLMSAVKMLRTFTEDWIKILKLFLGTILYMIKDPSFVMFSIIAIGLGTMGIWITFFTEDIKVENTSLLDQIDNLSVFTFCIATLGGIATDFFFEERYIVKDDKAAIHSMYFLWVVSVLVSFYSLNNDSGITFALILTLTFSLIVNKNKPMFKHPDKTALDNLNPNSVNNAKNQIKGAGL